MGAGLTSNPPSEGTTLTPAADVAPESFLTQDQLSAAASNFAAQIAKSPQVQQARETYQAHGWVGLLDFLAKHVGELLEDFVKALSPELVPVGKALVQAITPAITALSDIFAELSKAYTAEIARHFAQGEGKDGINRGTPGGNAAGYAFDSIVAPIAFFSSGTDPSKDGAGKQNIQQTLGIIVLLELVTWVINVISNLTGIGTLHFINSFTEVLTSALNCRSLSRLAMRPYINTFITEPATGELNEQHTLKSPSASADIRAYVRGAVTRDQMMHTMARQGYKPEVVAQLLLDSVHFMSLSDVGFLVRQNQWTQDQGITYLQQIGYDAQAAAVVLHREVQALTYSNLKAWADSMGTMVANGRLDADLYQSMLLKAGFNAEESASYKLLYASQREFKRPLTYTQVTNLYKAGLVDLDFVRQFLVELNNADTDIDLLILLDFTQADELNARKAALGATARVQSAREAEAAAAARAKGDQALADALAKQSAAKAKLASKYGQ